MNFITAVLHANVGYGIRRKAWHADAILDLDNFGEFAWLPRPKGSAGRQPCLLLGPDKTADLQPADVIAKDWETV